METVLSTKNQSTHALRLSRLLSDGMVLQKERDTNIWGWAEPDSVITVLVCGVKQITATGKSSEDGSFLIALPPFEGGISLTMLVKDDKGHSVKINNILTGDVFFLSGQSNMDLQMNRCADRYPDEIEMDFPNIRSFRIEEHFNFSFPEDDPLTGSWVGAKKGNISSFSATGYFFAKRFHSISGQPVGLIQASLGGSRVFCWLGRKMLAGYDDLLEVADQYADRHFLLSRINYNIHKNDRWHEKLDNSDKGLTGNWRMGWNMECPPLQLNVPGFFREVPQLDSFTGCLWITRNFTLPEDFSDQDGEKEYRICLGTITDSDITFLNGEKIGETLYQYPPRKYLVRSGLLRSGDNNITVRIIVENGVGRITPGVPLKDYALQVRRRCSSPTSDVYSISDKYNISHQTGISGFPLSDGKSNTGTPWENVVDLRGNWQFRIGAYCPSMPLTDFISYHPTGLYYGMTYPCLNYRIRGILWYQGESDADLHDDYAGLMKRLIFGWRKAWNIPDLPFYYVQLPNFSIDCADENEWPSLRQMQFECRHLPYTRMACALDLGEDNDLHPTGKKLVGYRLADLALHDMYPDNSQDEFTGPDPVSAILESDNFSAMDVIGTFESNCSTLSQSPDNGKNNIPIITLNLTHSTGIFFKQLVQENDSYLSDHSSSLDDACNPDHSSSQNDAPDFEIVDSEGNIFKASSKIHGNQVILRADEMKLPPSEVLYCYHNSPRGSLLFNAAGYPMPAFRIPVSKVNIT